MGTAFFNRIDLRSAQRVVHSEFLGSNELRLCYAQVPWQPIASICFPCAAMLSIINMWFSSTFLLRMYIQSIPGQSGFIILGLGLQMSSGMQQNGPTWAHRKCPKRSRIGQPTVLGTMNCLLPFPCFFADRRSISYLLQFFCSLGAPSNSLLSYHTHLAKK